MSAGNSRHGKPAAQLRAPEFDLVRVGSFVGEGLSLPQGEVAILHGQIGWTRTTTAGEGAIKVSNSSSISPMDNPSATM